MASSGYGRSSIPYCGWVGEEHSWIHTPFRILLLFPCKINNRSSFRTIKSITRNLSWTFILYKLERAKARVRPNPYLTAQCGYWRASWADTTGCTFSDCSERSSPWRHPLLTWNYLYLHHNHSPRKTPKFISCFWDYRTSLENQIINL